MRWWSHVRRELTSAGHEPLTTCTSPRRSLTSHISKFAATEIAMSSCCSTRKLSVVSRSGCTSFHRARTNPWKSGSSFSRLNHVTSDCFVGTQVHDALSTYVAEMDPLLEWWEERIVIAPSGATTTSHLHLDYTDWCRQHGVRNVLGIKGFAQRLTARGYPVAPDRTAGSRRHGLLLRRQPAPYLLPATQGR